MNINTYMCHFTDKTRRVTFFLHTIWSSVLMIKIVDKMWRVIHCCILINFRFNVFFLPVNTILIFSKVFLFAIHKYIYVERQAGTFVLYNSKKEHFTDVNMLNKYCLPCAQQSLRCHGRLGVSDSLLLRQVSQTYTLLYNGFQISK